MKKEKYDWEKIFTDQKQSGMSIKEYCNQNNICVSNFYKKKSNHKHNTFTEVEVTKHQFDTNQEELVTLKINETIIEMPISILDVVIKGIL